MALMHEITSTDAPTTAEYKMIQLLLGVYWPKCNDPETAAASKL